eukprot:3017746-Amphidinium_carterae.1
MEGALAEVILIASQLTLLIFRGYSLLHVQLPNVVSNTKPTTWASYPFDTICANNKAAVIGRRKHPCVPLCHHCIGLCCVHQKGSVHISLINELLHNAHTHTHAPFEATMHCGTLELSSLSYPFRQVCSTKVSTPP